ncbi:hypothetical protein M1146_00830 [Patescibacteria group bacterium]|nr:hypothetical protein [Patescibacteria group bacterium]
MKNNKNLIIAAVIILLIIGGGIFVLSRGKSSKPTIVPQQSEEVIPTLSPSVIGLVLTMGTDGKRVVMEVANTSDIESIDYTLSYTSKGNVPRGVIGHVDVKTKGQAVKKEIVLGTCSDVCHYDQEVTGIKIILKVTKSDGKVYQSEKSLQ